MLFNLRNSGEDRRKEKHLARFNIEDSWSPATLQGPWRVEGVGLSVYDRCRVWTWGPHRGEALAGFLLTQSGFPNPRITREVGNWSLSLHSSFALQDRPSRATLHVWDFLNIWRPLERHRGWEGGCRASQACTGQLLHSSAVRLQTSYFNLSMAQLPHLWNGEGISADFTGLLWRLSGFCTSVTCVTGTSKELNKCKLLFPLPWKNRRMIKINEMHRVLNTGMPAPWTSFACSPC